MLRIRFEVEQNITTGKRTLRGEKVRRGNIVWQLAGDPAGRHEPMIPVKRGHQNQTN